MEPGWIGIATGRLGRHRAFDMSLNRVIVPVGTDKGWEPSDDISYNYNKMVRRTLVDKKYMWLWILGDDHYFLPDLLLRLLAREVDIVVPLCIRRSAPYSPIIMTDKDDGFNPVDSWEWLIGKTGIVRMTDTTIGNAGMLVRRHVLEAMPSPWFEDGKTLPDKGGCDLWFCQKAIDAGFEVYLDTDNPIEHMTHIAVWPELAEDGIYRPVMHRANAHLKGKGEKFTAQKGTSNETDPRTIDQVH